jgi:hypothetical protein
VIRLVANTPMATANTNIHHIYICSFILFVIFVNVSINFKLKLLKIQTKYKQPLLTVAIQNRCKCETYIIIKLCISFHGKMLLCSFADILYFNMNDKLTTLKIETSLFVIAKQRIAEVHSGRN